MRATLLAIVAATACVATGCANFNLARRGGCDAPACADPVGCAHPMGCAAAVSPAVSPAFAPAGVASAVPPAPAAAAPYMPPAAAPYAPGPNVAPYDPGRQRRWHHGVPYQQGGAVVGYPYYTVRGPRDFLMDNPPSIGR